MTHLRTHFRDLQRHRGEPDRMPVADRADGITLAFTASAGVGRAIARVVTLGFDVPGAQR
jgi:hypothetical protein